MVTSATIITVCTVLHNLGLIINDIIEEDEIENDEDDFPLRPPEAEHGEGFIVRNNIIQRLFR